MGLVLRAYDPKLRREVALKLVYTGRSEAAEARVVREAQAMAQLSHPNIVAVYDVEVVDEQPYIAMEYVEGRTLRQWVDEQAPDWRTVLAAYLQAGRGLQAAHAAELIHRDFKPANVMRRPDGRVQVMDFGIAFDSEGADFSGVEGLEEQLPSQTATGFVMGTPAFMAPEQHAGKRADARSDQYAFCVSLWEGISGHRPFGGTGDAIVGAKQKLDIATPDAARSIPRHIKEVLRRGMAPKPDDRFESMSALMAALSVDRGRRRRALALTGVVALLGAGVAANAAQEAGARRQACRDAGAVVHATWHDDTKSRLKATFASTELGDAEVQADNVVARLDAYAGQWATERAELCLAQDAGRDPSPVMEQALTCYDDRLEALAALVELFEDADVALVRRAVRASIGLPPLSACGDEVWLRNRPAPPSDAAMQADLVAVRAMTRRASALHSAGRVAESEQQIDEALVAARALAWPPAIADALVKQALVLETMADYPGARRAAHEAFTVAIAAGHDDAALNATARLVYVVGYGLSEHDAAQQWAATGEALAARMGFSPDHLRLTPLLNAMGVLELSRGAYAESRAMHERVLAIKRRELGHDHLNVTSSLHNLGIACVMMDDLGAAEAVFAEALEITRAALGDEHLSVASDFASLGGVADARGDYEAAVRNLEHALAITETALGPDHTDVALILNNLGLSELEREQPLRALPLLERALRIQLGAARGEHPDSAITLKNIAAARLKQGRQAEAFALYERALATQRKLLGDDHPETVGTRTYLASIQPSAAEAGELVSTGD